MQPTPKLLLFSPRRQHLSIVDRYQLVVEAIEDYAFYMLDPEGKIETWNTGAELLKGYKASEVMGSHYDIFFREEDRREGLPMWQLERARIHRKTESEGWRVRKDGSVFWASILLRAIIDEDGKLIGYAKITRDITERQRLREMEHSLRRLNEFLAILGHEIRNPLAPMQYALELLQRRETKDTKASLKVMDRQLTHLTRLLDDLLDVGRLTIGKLRVFPRHTDFKAIVYQAVESAAPALQAKSHSLTVDLPVEQVSANVDELRIRQVLDNLIGNAIKFTPSGGHLAIVMQSRAERLVVKVSDDGMGMDTATIDNLFQLFAQGAYSRDQHCPGLGVGLALSRVIIEMHGGVLSGNSPGPGLGSVFSFDLPTCTVRSESSTRPARRTVG